MPVTVAAPTLEPVALRWLRRVYAHTTTGWVTLFAADSEGNRFTHWAPVDHLEQLAAAIDTHEPTSEMWFGASTRHNRLPNGRRGGDDDCAHVPALWVDIDVADPVHNSDRLPASIDDAQHLLDDFPISPTAVIHSGHGLQAWWMLAEPLEAAAAAVLLRRWGATWTAKGVEHGWHIDNVFDLARIMRLPGTHNRKADPVPVRILAADWDRYYGADDLDQWCIDPPEQQPTPIARVPYIGPERPGDVFNALRTGHDVLRAAGWAEDHRDTSSGDVHYRRPGRDKKGQSGATVYADDGHTTIWSETIGDATGVPIRRALNPWRLYGWLFHSGNWTNASDELERQGYGTKNRADDDLRWMIGDSLKPQNAPENTAEPGASYSTWAPVDLAPYLDGSHVALRPAVWARTDGSCLFYRARVNDLHGPSGEGKSFVSQAALAAELAAGNTVAMIDWEDHAGSLVQRLRSLGVPDDDIRHRFIYRHPHDRATLEALQAISAEIEAREVSTVVIDSTGVSLAIEGLNQDKDPDIVAWMNMLPKRCARAGACVICIDHVTKDPETRGLWAIGNQRKMGEIDGVSYKVEQVKPFAKGKSGLLKLVCAKDRNGTFARYQIAAEIDVTCRDDGGVELLAKPFATLAEKALGGIKLTGYAERISRWMEDNDGPRSRNQIELGVSGGTGYKRQSIEEMVAAGYLKPEGTRSGSVQFVLAKTFRADAIEHLVEGIERQQNGQPAENHPRLGRECPPSPHLASTLASQKPRSEAPSPHLASPRLDSGGSDLASPRLDSPPTGGRSGGEVPRPSAQRTFTDEDLFADHDRSDRP